MPIDFLIVAALDDEAKAIEQLLVDVRPESLIVSGTIRRWRGLGSFSIGLMNLFGMGPENAQNATTQAIAAYKPRAVLMTGIAAGFPESAAGVALGDLMLPYGIIPYEPQKIRRPAPKSRWERFLDKLSPWRPPMEVEHRGVACAVSEPLWRTAANAAKDTTRPWLSRMTVARPDGVETPPKIHALVDTLIGCGDKVVAHDDAEARQWLLACYPRQALGLEMESLGAFNACRASETPFLMAKASVDKATVEKDDRWRTYCCQLSAAFLITVLERYERPVTERIRLYREECVTAMGAVADRLPSTDFGYHVRTARSFEQLRRREYDDADTGIAALMPTEINPVVVLYAGGGAGKTTISRRLFATTLTDERLPLLLDLKRYAHATAADAGTAPQAETAERLVQASSVPRRAADELRSISAEARLLLIIDGVNEISLPARAALVSFCRELRQDSPCRILWTNRVSALEGVDGPDVLHATVSEVSEDVARGCFDVQFGNGRFDDLGQRLKSIMLRPFFLDLAIRSNRQFVGNRLWSGIFDEFLRLHLGLPDADIDELSRALIQSVSASGALRRDEWLRRTSTSVREKLRSAGVLDETDEFQHHLWQDYLFSRAFKLSKANWTSTTFDAATTFGTSPECLSMAVEQLPEGDRVQLIKAVYDWSYNVALDCVAHSSPTEEAERRLPSSLRQAILAVVAEKRFDPIPRTARRIEKVLSQYPFAKDYLADDDRDAMARRVAGIDDDVEWFVVWKRLYGQREGTDVQDTDARRITDEDSLIGWTAANLARRASLSGEAQSSVREIYAAEPVESGRGSVRWRAVHVLGRWPTVKNIELLSTALHTDGYHWVRYGAARSLVECAAASSDDLREKALQSLKQFVAAPEAGGPARHMILQEIVEASFVRNPAAGWTKAVGPLLEATVAAETQEGRRQALDQRVRELTKDAGE